MKESLVVDLGVVSDVEGLAERFHVHPATKLLRYNFVLVADEECDKLREQEAYKAAASQGGKVKVFGGVLGKE